MLHGFNLNFEGSSAEVRECLAIKNGLDLACVEGWDFVITESDALNVNAINGLHSSIHWSSTMLIDVNAINGLHSSIHWSSIMLIEDIPHKSRSFVYTCCE